MSGRWRGEVLGARPDRRVRQRRVAMALFVATCVSVFVVHRVGWQQAQGWDAVRGSLGFSIALMAMLVAHELGHWWAARWQGFRLSLPWFLPAPLLVGTLGAIIRIEERPPTRGALLVMGAAGPLVGAVAVVMLLMARGMWGVPEVDPGAWALRRPLLWWVVGAPFGATSPPTPSDPLGFAAWIGCLVTAMNLLPFGQLDGGHVFGALFPAWRERATWGVTAVLLLLAVVWPPWALWVAVLHLLGAKAPVEPKDVRSPPGPHEVRVAWAVALVFLLCVTPAPTSW